MILMHLESRKFKPPQGLLHHEEMIWVRHREASFGAWVPALLFFFGSASLGLLGLLERSTCTPFPQCVNFFRLFLGSFASGFLVVGFLTLGLKIAHRGTRYYLTNFRLVETRYGRIVKEISREVFRGLPTFRYLDKSVNGGKVRILDPRSGHVIMTLAIPDESMSGDIESIAKFAYCRYCGRKNEVASITCTYCGANL